MNLHLSVFRPYQRDAGHEDQLTRAALIVMQLVPLAQDAFLRIAGCPGLSELPVARFDMQTGTLAAPDLEADALQEVDELVSVFLAPHEGADTGVPDVNSQRTARYDGVVQYQSRLLLVIESKLFEGAPDWQSLALNTGVVTAANPRRVSVVWNTLLDRWWNLTETDLLSGAERRLLTDFFDFAEEHFGWLLPFTTLERCGTNPSRRRRRLRGLLTAATGQDATEHGNRAEIMFPPGRVVSIQRAATIDQGDTLDVSMWPAELVEQARHVFSSRARVDALLELADDTRWTVRPNFYVGYFNAPVTARWYTHADHRPIREYLEHWIEDLDERIGRHDRADVEDDNFWQWLLDRGYAVPEDRPGLDRLLATRVTRFDVRPSIEVIRHWKWTDAVDRDRAGTLVDDIAEAVDGVLRGLDEPPLAELRPPTGS